VSAVLVPERRDDSRARPPNPDPQTSRPNPATRSSASTATLPPTTRPPTAGRRAVLRLCPLGQGTIACAAVHGAWELQSLLCTVHEGQVRLVRRDPHVGCRLPAGQPPRAVLPEDRGGYVGRRRCGHDRRGDRRGRASSARARSTSRQERGRSLIQARRVTSKPAGRATPHMPHIAPARLQDFCRK